MATSLRSLGGRGNVSAPTAAPSSNNSWLRIALLLTTLISLSAVWYTLSSLSCSGSLQRNPFLDEQRPAKDSARKGVVDKRTLVVYSGPSSYQEAKHLLYEKNLDYFLSHGGVDCSNHDTIVVVGHEYFVRYARQINDINARCDGIGGGHFVRLVARRPVCKDMETARLAFYGGLGVDILRYDYFVYLNCGVSGPGGGTSGKIWADRLTSLLDDTAKMSGLSVNCEAQNQYRAHIQSMVYALDKKGIDLIYNARCAQDCVEAGGHNAIAYERCMGRTILEAGYGLAPILKLEDPALRIVTKDNRNQCNSKDLWMGSRLKALYGGQMPTLDEILFFKTSRILPEDIARAINYTDKVTWNWD